MLVTFTNNTKPSFHSFVFMFIITILVYEGKKIYSKINNGIQDENDKSIHNIKPCSQHPIFIHFDSIKNISNV